MPLATACRSLSSSATSIGNPTPGRGIICRSKASPWTSTIPGRTRRPRASIARSAFACAPTPAMIPPSHSRSTLASSREAPTSARPPSMRMRMTDATLRASGLLASIPRLRRLRPRHLRCSPLRLIRLRAALDRRQLVFFKEGLDRQLPEIGQRRPQSLVVPVPPRELVQPLRDGSRKALPNDARRVAGNDRIGIDVLGHYGAGRDYRARADGAARKDDRTVSDPDVVTDDDQRRAAPCEKFLFIPLARKIGACAIGHVRLRRPAHGMVALIRAIAAIEQNLPTVV